MPCTLPFVPLPVPGMVSLRVCDSCDITELASSAGLALFAVLVGAPGIAVTGDGMFGTTTGICGLTGAVGRAVGTEGATAGADGMEGAFGGATTGPTGPPGPAASA